jgi:hypothetical protein
MTSRPPKASLIVHPDAPIDTTTPVPRPVSTRATSVRAVRPSGIPQLFIHSDNRIVINRRQEVDAERAEPNEVPYN